jgi:hypothetical protein
VCLSIAWIYKKTTLEIPGKFHPLPVPYVRELSKPGSNRVYIKHASLSHLFETGWTLTGIEVQWLIVFGEGMQCEPHSVCLGQRMPGRNLRSVGLSVDGSVCISEQLIVFIEV